MVFFVSASFLYDVRASMIYDGRASMLYDAIASILYVVRASMLYKEMGDGLVGGRGGLRHALAHFVRWAFLFPEPDSVFLQITGCAHLDTKANLHHARGTIDDN